VHGEIPDEVGQIRDGRWDLVDGFKRGIFWQQNLILLYLNGLLITEIKDRGSLRYSLF
jgi:hypothetical protein